VNDLVSILELTGPREVYTHTMADDHETHVATLVKLINAIRRLPPSMRPEKLIGCEAWGSLDWLPRRHKVIMEVGNGALASDLVRVFRTQIEGGKRYDLAVRGRRRANATLQNSHAVDTCESVMIGMDMTPCIDGREMDPRDLYIDLWSIARDEKMDRLL
jgi:hypothetical protein